MLEKNGLEKTSENLYKCGTGRFEQISTFLAHRTELLQDDFQILMTYYLDAKNTTIEPTSKIMSNLKIKIEASSTENVKHRLIQISGK